MRSKNFKGSKCVKMKLQKSEEVVRTFDNIQTAYAQILDMDENIQKIQCNVVLDEIENGEFTTEKPLSPASSISFEGYISPSRLKKLPRLGSLG